MHRDNCGGAERVRGVAQTRSAIVLKASRSTVRRVSSRGKSRALLTTRTLLRLVCDATALRSRGVAHPTRSAQLAVVGVQGTV